jgi:hypothetical protein
MVYSYGELQAYRISKFWRGSNEKTQRRIASAPWFVSNKTIRTDFKIISVKDEIIRHNQIYQEKLENHPNH